MLFEQIRLCNMFSYYGEQVLNLQSPSQGKNVLLISGRNGFGKTNFINSLKLVFAGVTKELAGSAIFGRNLLDNHYLLGSGNEWLGVMNRRARMEGELDFGVEIRWQEVISSMSGVRAVPLGYSHSAAKAGLHHAVRSLALELNKRRIYVSEVMPGMVNTGMYDPPAVQMAIVEMGKYFGYDYKDSSLPQMPQKEVADAVKLCLTSEAHILSINLVAKGQWPNLSS